MTLQTRPDPKLIRASIALVWLYEGLWCKLLGGVPRHADVIAAAPFIGRGAARAALMAKTIRLENFAGQATARNHSA